MKYGELVLSTAHIPSAQGPYMVLHTLNSGTIVAVSLDGDHSINIPPGSAKPFPVSLAIIQLLIP